MSFPESVRTEAKQRSHYTCVWCQQTDRFLEVHHIIPEEESGPDTLDNAAPLCPNCHTNIGNNTEVRRQLRERRDWWWQQCAQSKVALPQEDSSRRLDQLLDSLRKIEAQGGRNEALLTEVKTRFVGQLEAQATAISSASTASQLIQASSGLGASSPTPYRLTATVTFAGAEHHAGMPEPYHSYFITSSTGAVMGPTGGVKSGAVVTIIPVAGDNAGPTQHLFAPDGDPADGMELARRTLRALPQNQGLAEQYYPRQP